MRSDEDHRAVVPDRVEHRFEIGIEVGESPAVLRGLAAADPRPVIGQRGRVHGHPALNPAHTDAPAAGPDSNTTSGRRCPPAPYAPVDRRR
jgi:hypothetical protein